MLSIMKVPIVQMCKYLIIFVFINYFPFTKMSYKEGHTMPYTFLFFVILMFLVWSSHVLKIFNLNKYSCEDECFSRSLSTKYL